MTPLSATAEQPEAPLFSDGLGDRVVAVDAATGDLLQILRVRPQLLAVPSFEFALRERAARLANFRHAYYARVRRIDRHPAGLAIVSDHVEGVRLSEILRVASERKLQLDLNAALCLLRQLVPSLALLHENARDVAHGIVSPERLIVTPRARLVVVEHVLGSAVEQLHYNRERLWQELRIAMPPAVGISRFDHRADVTAIGLVALALVLGRPITGDEYPQRIGQLLSDARARAVGAADQPLPESLHNWIARALQLDPRQGYTSATEAQVALEDALADDSGFVAAPVALETFLSRYIAAMLEPAPPVMPAAVSFAPPVAPPVVAPTPPMAPPVAVKPATTVLPPAPVTTPAADVRPLAPIAPPTPPPAPVQAAPPVVVRPVAPAPSVVPAPPIPAPAAQTFAPMPPPAPPVPPVAPVVTTPHVAIPLAPSAPKPTPAPVPPPPAPVAVGPLTVAPATQPAKPVPPAPATAARDITELLRDFDVPAPSTTETRQDLMMPPPAQSGGARRIALVAVLVAALGGGGFYAYQTFTTKPAGPTLGTLSVQTNPPGVAVFVDGVARGNTPARLSLSAGSHIVELRGRGVPRVIPVTITAGSEASQYLELPETPSSGSLLVQSDPAGARVTVDGVDHGLAPVSVADLSPGEHEVVLQAEGGTPVKQRVLIQAGVTSSVLAPVSTAAAGPVSGWLTVKAPVSLEIHEGGRLIGTTDSQRLMMAAGRHEIELVNQTLGYSASRTIQVVPGKVLPLNVELPMGSINVNASPWAEIWIDGQRVGETPIGNLPVSIGPHEIVFRHPQLGEKRQAVSVTLKAPVRLSVDMK
jgi:hypothetical protein